MSQNICSKSDDFGGEIQRSEVEAWMKLAREQTPETLPDFLKDVHEAIPVSYGNAVHRLAISAIATTWAYNKSQAGGITGFQASCVMWEYIEFWMSKHTPHILLDYEDMLYPQSEEKFTSISQEIWDWIRKTARERLEKDSKFMAPAVAKHMDQIIMGRVPFGYRVRKGDR